MKYESLEKIYYKDRKNYEEYYLKRFNSEDAVHIDIKIGEYPAFFCMTSEIHKNLLEILKKDRIISRLCLKLPEMAIRHFKYRALIDEIVITNNIEGVYSSRKEIRSVINMLNLGKEKQRFGGLVRKYQMLGSQDGMIENCQELRELYDELVLNEVAENDKMNIPDGKIFRKEGVSVAKATGKIIHSGLSPEEKIIAEMDKSLKYLNDSDDELAVRVAVYHYLFGYIHPFYDGNGRTARFIASSYLTQELESLIGYRLSYVIQENLNKYYKAFEECNSSKNRGELTSFIIFFLELILMAEENIIDELGKRSRYYEKYHNELIEKSPLMNDKQLALCELLLQGSLFSECGITQNELREKLGISSPQTLAVRFREIREMGLLKESEERDGRIRYYMLNLEKLDELI